MLDLINFNSVFNSVIKSPVMKKALPSYHKGIEFVQISKLPLEQYLNIKERFPMSKLLTLDFYGHLLEDCIRYADYEFWYEHLYNQDRRFEIEI